MSRKKSIPKMWAQKDQKWGCLMGHINSRTNRAIKNLILGISGPWGLTTVKISCRLHFQFRNYDLKTGRKSIYLSIHISSIYPFINPPIYLPIYLSTHIYQPIHPSIKLSTNPLIHPSIYPPIYPFIYPFIHLPINPSMWTWISFLQKSCPMLTQH